MRTSLGLEISRARTSGALRGPSSAHLLRYQSCVRARARSVAVRAVLDPTDIIQHAQTLAEHLPLAYEPVAAPCSLMNCGDVVHRR